VVAARQAVAVFRHIRKVRCQLVKGISRLHQEAFPKVMTDLSGSADDFGRAIAIQADGEMVVTGTTGDVAGFDFALARYIAVAQKVAVEQIIPDVQGLVASGVLNNGQGTSLLVKLPAAIRQPDSGKNTAAKQLLQAFVDQVNAFINGRILTPAQGQPLIDAAEAVIGTRRQPIVTVPARVGCCLARLPVCRVGRSLA
jgi:hypothetical protein